MIGAPLRTLVVDDEPIARARLGALCPAMPDTFLVIGEAADGGAALDRIAGGGTDLVLLDIAMPGLDGLTVAAALTRTEAPPAVVFCTAHPSHALEAFEAAAADYLLKPVGQGRLARAAERAARLRERAPITVGPMQWLDHVWVPHRDAMLRIEMRDVERVEAEGDYVRLVTGQVSHLLHETMTRLEQRLDPEKFVRVRRSTIVRTDVLAAATHLGGGAWNVSLVDGGVVRVGPTYWKALKGRFTKR